MNRQDTVAFRIEYKGTGPFWNSRVAQFLSRKCRQVAPEWKSFDEICESFLEYYCFHADSPHDHAGFAWHLDRGTKELRFGFSSMKALFEECGIRKFDLYEKQLRGLLDTVPGFCVRAYMVEPLAQSRSEILFQENTAVCLEEATSWTQLLSL